MEEGQASKGVAAPHSCQRPPSCWIFQCFKRQTIQILRDFKILAIKRN